jgi:hypothetical protein
MTMSATTQLWAPFICILSLTIKKYIPWEFVGENERKKGREVNKENVNREL